MNRQVSLDFNGERVAAAALWRQLPKLNRQEALTLLARLIAAAAQKADKAEQAAMPGPAAKPNEAASPSTSGEPS